MTNQQEFNLDQMNPSKIHDFVKILRKGGVVIYPTDTVAGIGARADCAECIARIHQIKGRQEKKPFSIAFGSIQQMKDYIVLNAPAKKLADKYLPGDLTMIVQLRNDASAIYANPNSTAIGVRIIGNKILNTIITNLGIPIVTTSANRSGRLPAKTVANLDSEIVNAVDAIIKWKGELNGEPSTVVDVRTKIKILREGRLSKLHDFMD